MKHTKQYCMACDVELTDDNWYPSRKRKNERNCITCHDTKRLERKIRQIGISPGRMAKLLHFKHLTDYDKIKEGFVYIITNPAWPKWVKVGMAVEAHDRCKGYQTASPFRDYKVYFKKFFDNRRNAEKVAHKLLSKSSKTKKGEWFQISKAKAKVIIESL